MDYDNQGTGSLTNIAKYDKSYPIPTTIGWSLTGFLRLTLVANMALMNVIALINQHQPSMLKQIEHF